MEDFLLLVVLFVLFLRWLILSGRMKDLRQRLEQLEMRPVEAQLVQRIYALEQEVAELKRRGVRAASLLEAWLMSHKLLILLLMLGVLGALVAGEKGASLAQIRFFWFWTFGRQDLALSPGQATMTYQRLLKTLRKKGHQKPAAQTPREFAQSLAGTRLGSGVWEFTRLYNLLRFGQAEIPMSRLRQLLDEISRTEAR